MTMGLLLIILLVLAVLAMGSWGYSSYGYRTAAPAVVTEPAAGPSPIITIIGVLGLLAIVAFFVLWAVAGWKFDFEAIPPR
jgi:hypothetical protein